MISMELVCLYLIPVLTSLLYVYPLKPAWLGRIQIVSSTALFVVITQIIQSISQWGPQFFAERMIYIDARRRRRFGRICRQHGRGGGRLRHRPETPFRQHRKQRRNPDGSDAG